ncbi:MAG: hypothetical protein ACR2HJ_05575 [Fimbriimonadales bacterium]
MKGKRYSEEQVQARRGVNLHVSRGTEGAVMSFSGTTRIYGTLTAAVLCGVCPWLLIGCSRTGFETEKTTNTSSHPKLNGTISKPDFRNTVALTVPNINLVTEGTKLLIVKVPPTVKVELFPGNLVLKGKQGVRVGFYVGKNPDKKHAKASVKRQIENPALDTVIAGPWVGRLIMTSTRHGRDWRSYHFLSEDEHMGVGLEFPSNNLAAEAEAMALLPYILYSIRQVQ